MLNKDRRYSFRKGVPKKSIVATTCMLRYQPNPEGPKVAVVVSKKVDKKAVVRNRLKRRFYHIVEEILHENVIPFDVVFFLREGIKESDDIKDEVHSALLKAGILT